MMTEMYVVVARDRNGKPRGFEKVSDGRFFLIYGDAVTYLKNLPSTVRESFMVARVLAQMEPPHNPNTQE